MEEFLGSGDPGVDVFVDANLTSFIAWDVVVYLEHNADASADLVELSSRLGRKESEVEPVLSKLAANGIAQTSVESDGVVRYALSTEPASRRVVTRFVELAKVRELRLEFVRRVLAGMSRG